LNKGVDDFNKNMAPLTFNKNMAPLTNILDEVMKLRAGGPDAAAQELTRLAKGGPTEKPEFTFNPELEQPISVRRKPISLKTHYLMMR
jgi:hypothetical protein